MQCAYHSTMLGSCLSMTLGMGRQRLMNWSPSSSAKHEQGQMRVQKQAGCVICIPLRAQPDRLLIDKDAGVRDKSCWALGSLYDKVCCSLQQPVFCCHHIAETVLIEQGCAKICQSQAQETFQRQHRVS